MRKAVIAVGCLLGSLSAFGQGYLQFANLGAGCNSPFHDYTGLILSGAGNYTVELLVGASRTTVTDSLTPLFTGNFSSGYFNGGSRIVPAADIDGSGKTWVIVRVWNNQGGGLQTYFEAAQSGGETGITTAFQVTPEVSAQVPPAPLVGMPLINGIGTLLIPVPEPSVWTLGLLGVVALVGCRRRSR